jgi:dTDP-4-dehydrorhamnose reductase
VSKNAPTPGRIVVTGAGGQVGRYLTAEVLRRGGTVVALTSAQCDITDPRTVDGVVARDDVLVNCAAVANVDVAERDESRAYAVNTVGPELLARACAEAGARLIHLSTDYVFSGEFGKAEPRPYEPTDDPRPLSVYGRSKLAGERAVLAALAAPGQATVVRTSWVYTGATAAGDFVADMRKRAAAGEPTEQVDDQIGSPTFVADLVAALLRLACGDIHEPVLHVANAGTASRFDQATAVYAAVGADASLVTPISGVTKPRPAARPSYSALGSRVSTAVGLAPPRPWREALHAAVAAAASGDG